MSNRFKTPELRETYTVMVNHYRNGTALWHPDGSENRGAAHRNAFWNGFHHLPNRAFPPGSYTYAAYRAGWDMGDPHA